MKKRISRILGVGLTLALLSSLLIGIVPASANVSSATVTLSDNTISETAVTYTVTFLINAAVDAGEDIDVEFPLGTDLTAVGAADIAIYATSGIGTDAVTTGPAAAAVNVSGTNNLEITLPGAAAMNAQNSIGAGATVQLVIDDVTNYGAPGSYVLQVSTDAEPTDIDSQSFTLVPPYVPPAPGVVTLYNDAEIPMATYTGLTAIQDAITAGTDDWIVEIGPGTYDEDPNGLSDGMTLRALTPGTAIVQCNTGGLYIDVDDVTLLELNIVGYVELDTVDGTAVTDCVFTTGPFELLVYGGSTGTAVSGCTFDVTGATALTGIDTVDAVTVTGCDFTADTNGVGIDTYDDGVATVNGCTFNGSSGEGMWFSDDAVGNIDGCTFTGLDTAIWVGTNVTGDATIDVQTSTFTGCGNDTLNWAVIQVDSALAFGVTIINNTFESNNEDLMEVNGDADAVFFKFNTCDNSVGFDNDVLGVTLDCTNNWWGSSAGPTVTSTGAVQVDPWLLYPVTGAYVVTGVGANTNVDGSATVGVEVISNGTMSCVGLANYADNPVPGQPYLADVVRWFEINVVGLGAPTNDIQISLHGITNTAAAAYAWSTYMDMWVNIPCTVDLFTGEVRFTLDENTSPSNANLNELVFALTEPAAPPLGAPPVLSTLLPLFGDESVPITPILFQWAAVANATSYEFQISEDIGGVPWAVIKDSRTVTINQHVSMDALKYETGYMWRVRALSATETGDWVESYFTTVAEPEEPAPPIEIVQQDPPVINIPDWPDTVYEETAPVIPDYLLWVVVGVGAVLVIAVIVLIVRTRRVA